MVSAEYAWLRQNMPKKCHEEEEEEEGGIQTGGISRICLTSTKYA